MCSLSLTKERRKQGGREWTAMLQLSGLTTCAQQRLKWQYAEFEPRLGEKAAKSF